MREIEKSISQASTRHRDLNLATAQICLGAKLKNIHWISGVAFIELTPLEVCQDLEAKFYSGELLIDPRQFSETYRQLKHQIYDAKRLEIKNDNIPAYR
jgi:hypothetical protein